MKVGEQLFVSCLKRKDHKILSVVQKQWLDDDEALQYRCIMEYYREHGEMMGLRTFVDKFGLDSSGADSRPAYYLNALKERYIFATVSEKVPKILKGIKSDPRGRLSEFQSLIAMLSVDAVESKDTLYSDDIETRIEEYKKRTEKMGVTHLSMGAPDMDATFYGYRKNDLITIGGKAGVGKSWLMLYLAFLLEGVVKERCELGETLGDILFITNEMGEDEIKERIDCLKFHLPFEAFQKGTLTERERKRYFQGLKKLTSEPSKLRIVYSCQTIDELSTYIGLFQPSAVFIDGSYLMESRMQEGWEKIVYITRNLKRLAKNFSVPIINSTQLKRGSSKTASKYSLDGQDDFAYSNSYSQDSDLAIRMFQDADMKFHDVVGCEVVKGRRVKGNTTFVFQNDLTNMCQSLTLPADESSSTPVVPDL